MKLTQRISLFFQSGVHGVLDSLEDPERSLHQVVLDMERQLESAKRAAAQAMANEERLRVRIEGHRREADECEAAARRFLTKDREDDTREALTRSERQARLATELEEQLAQQRKDTEQIRRGVERLHNQVEAARSRHRVLLAKMRQGEARRAMGQVMHGVAATHLQGEFDRLGEKLETHAATDAAYLEIHDDLTGEGLMRRYENDAVDEAVDDRLAALKATRSTPTADRGVDTAKEDP